MCKASQVCELMYEVDAKFPGQVCELISRIYIRKLANQLFVCELKCKMFDC